MNPPITFESLREANHQRHQEWANGNDLPLSFRGVELAGEVGEACNELKKLERTRLGLVGGKTDLTGLQEELADVLICVDLIAMDLGIDLASAVQDKFNATSEKYDLSTRL
ncbi:MAG: MazG-like family protein [Mariniblastus sp.]|nr:MazG-like family protein [Mariniblastus sp.]